jgi:hypothetical protein
MTPKRGRDGSFHLTTREEIPETCYHQEKFILWVTLFDEKTLPQRRGCESTDTIHGVQIRHLSHAKSI